MAADAVPHVVGKSRHTARLIKDFSGVMVGVGDRGNGEAYVTLFGPKRRVDAAGATVAVVARGLWSFPRRLKERGFPMGLGLGLGRRLKRCGPGLVYWGGSQRWHAWSIFFRSVLFGFYWFTRVTGLVDEGSVGVLSFGAFPWPFFFFWVRNWNFSRFRRFWFGFGVLGLSVGNGIGSGPSFIGGTLT